MAWNEPGGSGNKDPWGNRNNQQGPPDLDEIIRKIQRRIGGLFGGRGGGGNGGNRAGGGVGAGLMGIVVVIALAIWGLSGIYIVETGNQGVVLQFGAFKELTNPGPHWVPTFIQTVEIVEVDRSRSERIGLNTSEALMLTRDENIVDIKVEVQYKVSDPKHFLFNVQEPAATLRQATESALREVVGNNFMDFVLTTGRSDVSDTTKKLLQNILDRYDTGLLVTELNLEYTDAPEQVKPAFLDASSAREDKERFINEAQAYSNDILPKARGQASRLVQEAQAYREEVVQKATGETQRFLKILAEYKKAPKVTRERLYLETMEQVLGNSNKVMVDLKKGNSLMYLPIDQLIKNRRKPASGDAASSSSSVNSFSTLVTPDTPRSRDRLRSRENR